MNCNCAVGDILSIDTADETVKEPFDEATETLNKYAFEAEEQLAYPAIVGIELVEGCNLSCSHCFLKSRPEPTTYHTMAQLRELYEQVVESKALKVYLTGGEAMLHPSFVEAVELFADGPFDLMVFTNGTLVDEETVARLDHLTDDVSFQVSLDGLGEVHENIRGVAAETVLDGIKRLVDAGFEVHVRSTIQPQNVESIATVYEACLDLSVDYVDFAPLMPTVGWENLSEQRYAEYEESVVTNYASFLRSRDEFPVPICQNPVSVPFGWDTPAVESFDAYLCPAASLALEVDATGEVYPCPYLHYEEFSAGNVYDSDLLSLWRGVDSEEWKTMIDYWNTDHEVCSDCQQADACKGACHAAGYHRFGDLEAPDFRCPAVSGGASDV